jgi:DNA-binding LacI/PurR family transcriptional regulator
MPGVSESTRARIRSIADDLSYVVSPEASGLASGTTGRVAVVVPKINLWFFSTMLAGIEGVLRDAEMDVLIYHVDGAEERRWFFERLPARRKADAVIVIALPVSEEEAERLDLIGVHVVIAGGKLRDYPHVRVDDVDVGRRAVGHLVELGHRDIAMIRTHDREGSVWAADQARSKGYHQALAEAGIPHRPELMVTVDWGIHGGARAMEELLSREHVPTAVFAYSDEVALGALLTLRRAGVPVPAEVSVIGVDDHPMSELYELTTVRQPVELQGVMAGRLALDLLRQGETTQAQVTLPTELVVRGTTAPPAAPSRP